MQDMNFFSQFSSKKKSSDSSVYVLLVVVGIVAAFIIGTLAYNNISIYLNNKETERYRDKVEEKAPEIAESNKVNLKIDALTEYDSRLDSLIDTVNSRDVIDVNLFNKICSTIPSEVLFSSINISSSTITISGKSTSRTAIAELHHNLREFLSEVYSVYIPSITGNEGGNEYTFDVTCKLQEVDEVE